jgi:hypothetical protein
VPRAAIPLLLVAALAAGCSAATRRPTHLLDDGAAAIAPDRTRNERLERVGRSVLPTSTAPDAISFGLSSRDALGAWSWADGRIRTSRALVDLLDDDELAAALAHEIGHLLDGGHIAGAPAALSGADGTPGPEGRADLIACRILAAGGGRPEALPRMLRAVAAHLGDDAEGPDPGAMLRRAADADAACAPRR